MFSTFTKIAIRAGVAMVLITVTIILVRAFDSRSLPDLMAWHTTVLESEFSSRSRTADFTFDDYLKTEERVFAELEEFVASDPHPGMPRRLNRYSKTSPLNPLNDKPNWNRSYEMRPDSPVAGIILLHGLTDSPYSMHALAQVYLEMGYHVVVPRMPGHGTVPTGILQATVDDWSAVVELSVIHLRNALGPDLPLHMGGYSNGAALAIRYTLVSIRHNELETPQRLLLVSPEIAVTAFAAFATWNRILSFLPYFRKFKWEAVLPEYDPYKYNSFPKAAGAQSYVLTKEIQKSLVDIARNGDAHRFPPILAFQSLVDSTVSTDAVVTDLFENLENEENHLVLFDINRLNDLHPMLDSEHMDLVKRLRDTAAHHFRVTLVTNADTGSREVMAVTRSGENISRQALDLIWPQHMYSLSHVALPFHPDDSLYGNSGVDSTYGISLGALIPRGEKHVLTVPKELLMRVRFNPFFSYMKLLIQSEFDN